MKTIDKRELEKVTSVYFSPDTGRFTLYIDGQELLWPRGSAHVHEGGVTNKESPQLSGDGDHAVLLLLEIATGRTFTKSKENDYVWKVS